jgi:hypothetical protein
MEGIGTVENRARECLLAGTLIPDFGMKEMQDTGM